MGADGALRIEGCDVADRHLIAKILWQVVKTQSIDLIITGVQAQRMTTADR